MAARGWSDRYGECVLVRLSDCAIAIGLIVLLTWLLVRGLQPPDPQTEGARRALDRYAAAQGALHRDVLRARAGILRSYAPLASHITEMRRELAVVRLNLEDAEAVRLLAPIAAEAEAEGLLTQRFTKGNALLRNSLAQFALFSDRLTRQPGDGASMRAIEGLSGEVLHLTLDTSRGTIAEVDAMIAKVRSSCRRAGCPADAEILIAHACLLHDLVPRVDGTVARLVGADRSAAIGRLRTHLDERERAVETASVQFRLLLYGISLVLLYLLLKRERQLRLRAAELRRQVALEHAVVSLSTGLIGGGEDLFDRVRTGLAEVAGALGAKRGYFHRADTQTLWASAEGDAAHGNIAAAVALAQGRAPDSAGITLIRLDDRATTPREAALLQVLGVEKWICVRGIGDNATGDFLAFDVAIRRHRRPAGQMTVLRTALDAICLALDHDAAERERSRLAEQLVWARRMETIGAFTSGIAHNFNNLIGAIGGHAEMVQARLQDDSPTMQHVDQIQLAAQRGRDLVQGLLDYGRRRDYCKDLVDLGALARETGNLAEAALAPRHAIVVAPALDDTLVLTDPAQLQQVLLNLCTNAAQAMGDGGTVRVETSVRLLAEPLQHPHGPVPAGRYATVTVADTGAGIERDRLHRLFEPFYTTKPYGNGLGLSTAREIVRELGGIITISSRPGIGTTARIWLPLHDRDSTTPPGAARLPLRARGNGEVVLTMFPELRARLAGEDLLAALGYEPVGVESPARLLEAIERQPDGFDAVLICSMEDNDAVWSLLAAIRRRCPGLPRILAIGASCRPPAARLAGAGISAVVPCPPGPAELAAALRRSLDAPAPALRDGRAGAQPGHITYVI